MRIGLLITLCCCLACGTDNQATSQTESTAAVRSAEPVLDTTPVEIEPAPAPPDTSELERTLIAQGLVNAADLDSSFVVQMMYSTEDNFLDADVYGEYDKCYLQSEVADKLVRAQQFLREAHPELRLILFDCVRPRSVQYQMWEIVKGTDQQGYVAPPGGSGSMHNYGAAVDLGLTHMDSGLVDMGTPFDFFGPLAQPRYEARFLESGQLTAQQIENRRILRRAMKQAGFQGIQSEWWHFIGFGRNVVRQRYQIVE